ncbi:MAG: single-stranded-DNA-specific exonuclease RecJ [Spirochaetales bacterium]|uniref:Single-stranded-DNA-specific exonuclease RecJ n=1 Tax=Candidatus Thalassospirochaeta sargassi TaxID=3119039 RepID=A0AAJ1MJ51_9SPIO|nr:single-stranded-DNA-specific exonuclease RecJ [Spirochaetales bacterium]
MVWNKKNISADKVREISGRFGIDLLPASIFVRRGITDFTKLKFYLEDDLQYLHSPFNFEEMEEIIDRIKLAASEGEKVKIFGDRDVDGITSTVLLYNELTSMGIEASWRLPEGDDPYGLTIQAVDEFREVDGSLLITVDCGISNYNEIKHAADLGIDTIVIDHHNSPEVLPPAYGIINPKMEDSCYPFMHLAGCGVVSKVVWALRFSRLDLYNQEFCMLNIRPGNESYILEAVRVKNLVAGERITETLVPGMVDLANSRLLDFLQLQIIVYDAEPQKKMLQRIFGNNTDIHLVDAAPEIWKVFPSLQGKSLLKMRDGSRMVKYSQDSPGEVDVFLNLFAAFIYKREESLSSGFEKELDLVALGTIADLMPLEDENRIIVKRGMQQIMKTQRPGLRTLLASRNLLAKTLSTTDIGWQLTPTINATGRMGVPSKAVELLLGTDAEEINRLTEEVGSLNRKRKKLGEDVWAKVLPSAKRSYQDLEAKLVIVADKSMNRGITGIIASRLASFFGVPAIAVSIMDDKAVGSVRSAMQINVKDFIAGASDLFIDYGGHDFAAGFSLKLSKFAEFTARIEQLAPKLKGADTAEASIKIDAELPPSYLNPDLIKTVEMFEPYGENNPPLIFLSRGVTIESMELMGKSEQKHLRLLFAAGKYKWPAVYWNAADRANRDFSRGDKVDIVFRLGRNYFMNKESLQLTVLDLEK